jgi:N6-L-threonylcarbamoyladenine synthase
MHGQTVILAIESSCDDTGAAISVDGKILANRVADQKVHEEFGGVVPELASRAHQRNIVPVVEAVLKDSGLALKEMDAIAYTRGPGLMGSLLVGSSYAKSLAWSLGIPSIAVDHMQGHILSHFILDDEIKSSSIGFPFLNLTVSGGHTEFVSVKGPFEMEVVGRTLDDAAGEAFDKSAKMMGIPYPGGPHIDRLAVEGEARFTFSKPNIQGLDMSFSGLKTSILYFLQREVQKDKDFIEENKADLCASIQNSIVSILMEKLEKAIESYRPEALGMAGGVAANSGLRAAFVSCADRHGLPHSVPPMRYCTDNAAMIAMVGHFAYQAGYAHSLDTLPTARLSLEESLDSFQYFKERS